jgi:hypothetical protein
MRRNAVLGIIVVSCLSAATLAETKKELRYSVGPKANVSLGTQYGGITVKPGNPGVVIAVLTLKSDKTEVLNSQAGNRIEIRANGTDPQHGRVDCELTVPPDAIVSLRSTDGPMFVDRLQGDLSFEAVTAPVEVRHATGGGHIHVHTMSGPVTLADVHQGHVEITSVSGDVHLSSVSGPLVEVNAGSGRIFYDGDFGSGGDYKFVTSSGDIAAVIPPDASAEVSAHSVKGDVKDDAKLTPKAYSYWKAGSSFVGTAGKAASQVLMRSFSGKISLKLR